MMLRVCAWIAIVAYPFASHAEPTPARPAPPKATAKAKPGGKVMRFSDDVVIEGKVHKPSAFYVLSRSTIDTQWDQIHEAFLPKILESVKGAPF